MAIKSLVPFASLSASEKRLVRAARKAVENSYCPYSKFAVGAAILTYDNRIFSGCNIESCSAGATVCAERVALFKAVSEGYRRFKAIAIYAPSAPRSAASCGCGICRQMLAEFGLDVLVLKLRNDGMVVRKLLGTLLPNAFVPGIVSGAAGSASLKTMASAIVASLSPDLLKPRYRRRKRRNKFVGHCYTASEALYHMLGARESGYMPQVVRHEGGTHWYLKHLVSEKIVDLTARQFRRKVPYQRGKGCGFLTKKPSNRAQVLITRARAKLAPAS